MSAELFLPRRCLICERRISAGDICSRCAPGPARRNNSQCCMCCFSGGVDLDPGLICPTCRTFPPLFGKIRWLWEYRGKARALINTMKYKPSPALARAASSRLAAALPDFFPCSDNWDLIVPIPSSRKSFCQRTFNQCAIIARTLARAVNRTSIFCPGALQHLGSRHPQASLPARRRIGNVRRSFRADPRVVTGRRILLVDDVITTGATSAAAALALYRAGCATVDLASLACCPAWSQHRAEVYHKLVLPGFDQAGAACSAPRPHKFQKLLFSWRQDRL